MLDDFSTFTPALQNKILFEISMAPDSVSLDMLNHMIRTADLSKKLKERILDLILEKAHENSAFIDTYLQFSGTKRLTRAVPLLASTLITESDPALLLKIIHSLGKLRDPSCINVIADFIFYEHDDLKRAAVNALADIGTKNAIDALKKAAMTSKADPFLNDTLSGIEKRRRSATKNDATMTEQRASQKDTYEALDDDSDLAQLLLMLNAPSITDQHLAMDLLAEMGPQIIPAVFGNMDVTRPESIINTLTILSQMKKADAVQAILKIIKIKHPDIHVNIAAYEAIKRLEVEISTVSLIEGMKNESLPVRIAAAMAMDSKFSDVLIEGLKGIIETGGKTSGREESVAAIIDGFADNLFIRLLESDAFVFTASNYLQSAPVLIRKHFTDLLKQKGSRSLAQSIENNSSFPVIKHRLTVFVIDSSSIMRQIYYKYLIDLGFYPVLFSDPQNALNAIESALPDIVLTDSFLPHMNGLSFACEIRKRFTAVELPLILFIHGDGDLSSVVPLNNGHPAELNRIIKKPMTDKELLNVISVEIIKSASKMLKSNVLENRYRALSQLAANLPASDQIVNHHIFSNDLNLVIDLLKITHQMGLSKILPQLKKKLAKKMTHTGIRLALILSFDNEEQKSVFPMIDYISDPDEHIRFAAIHAISKYPAPKELTRIRAIMDSSDPDKSGIVSAILDSRSITIFESLLSSDSFINPAADYLSLKASPAVRKEFSDFLINTGRKALAQSILSSAAGRKPDPEKTIFIVDEHKALRLFMEKKLVEMNCMARCFSSFDATLEAIRSSKPDLLITSLFVANDSCFPFINKIREKYSQDDLNVLLLSTGNELGDAYFRDSSKNNAVEGILYLPFSDKACRDRIYAK